MKFAPDEARDALENYVSDGLGEGASVRFGQPHLLQPAIREKYGAGGILVLDGKNEAGESLQTSALEMILRSLSGKTEGIIVEHEIDSMRDHILRLIAQVIQDYHGILFLEDQTSPEVVGYKAIHQQGSMGVHFDRGGHVVSLNQALDVGELPRQSETLFLSPEDFLKYVVGQWQDLVDMTCSGIRRNARNGSDTQQKTEQFQQEAAVVCPSIKRWLQGEANLGEGFGVLSASHARMKEIQVPSWMSAPEIFLPPEKGRIHQMLQLVNWVTYSINPHLTGREMGGMFEGLENYDRTFPLSWRDLGKASILHSGLFVLHARKSASGNEIGCFERRLLRFRRIRG